MVPWAYGNFAANQSRPRVEWLLDGLDSKHRQIRIRASEELQNLTGMSHGYDGGAPKRTREEARKR